MDSTELGKFIGTKISVFRRKEGWTQAQLAKKIGVSTATIGNYEIGYRAPHHGNLAALADIFGISIDDFYPVRSDLKPVVMANTPDPSWKPTITQKDERKIEERLEEIKAGFGGANAANDGLGLHEYSVETQQAVLNGVEQLLHMMALERKTKFTSNKNKKVKGED